MLEFHQHGPAASAVPEPVTAFCSFLISAGALTSWQCEKLRNGQWKGFFQGEFVLLDGLGTIDGCFHSLGRHVKTGRYARLVSDPTKGDGIQFATRVVSWLGEAD